jgi:hypothetical protein
MVVFMALVASSFRYYGRVQRTLPVAFPTAQADDRTTTSG